jgi:plastocyanin
MVRRWPHAASVLLCVTLAACGGSSPAKKPVEPSVTIRMFAFRPQRLTVATGTMVTWSNTDQILHTATSGTGPSARTDSFDGSMDGAGKTFTFRFTAAGTYPYFCSRHPTVPSMHGSIIAM